MCGIGPAHVRRLCDNSWEGGFQFTPQQVGEMTLDQIFMLLADKKILRAGKHRSDKITSEMASMYADKDGFIHGRSKDGKPIKAKIHGKSLAQRIKDGEIELDMEGRRIEKPKVPEKETRRQRRKREAEEQKRREELERKIREFSD